MKLTSAWPQLLPFMLVLMQIASIGYPSFNASAGTLAGYTRDANIANLDYAFTALNDQQGYLWFGNRTGLHQYDGYELKTIALSGISSSSSNPHVRSLLIDDNQFMWIGTSQGLQRYNPIKQTVEAFTNAHWNLPNDLNISAMAMDKNGILWMATLNFGLTYFDTNTKKLGKIRVAKFDKDPDISKQMWDIKLDADNQFWLASKNGLYHLKNSQLENGRQHASLIKKYTVDNSQLLSNLVTKLHLDSQQNLWIGTSKGLNYYHKQSRTISTSSTTTKEANPLIDVNITSFIQDRQNRLWISTWGKGVHILDQKQRQLLDQQQGFKPDTNLALDSFIYNDYPTDDIQTNNIYHLLADNKGLVWVIGDNGIKIMRTDALVVEHYDYMPDFSSSTKNGTVIEDTRQLPRQPIKFIFEDSQGIQWLAGNKGLSRFNRADRTLVYLFYQLDTDNKLPSSHCATLFEDRQKNIWVGSQVGLSLYDPQTQQFKREIFEQFNRNELNLAHSDDSDSCAIEAIEQDVDDKMWIANGHRLIKFDSPTRQFSFFNLPTPDGQPDHQHNIITMKYDGDNTLWLAKAHHGLGKFDLTTNQYSSFYDIENAPNAEINDIRIENKNSIWIATDNGLWLFDGIGTFKQFNNTTSNTSTYKTITLDNHNNIWIGTNKGLKSFNTKTQTFTNYDKSMGLINDEYNQKAAFKAKDGRLYFAGSKGIDYFDPQALIANLDKQPLKVVLTDFILGNHSAPITSTFNTQLNDSKNTLMLDKAINYLDSITLTHLDKLFKFEFSTFSFLNPKQTRFAFRLAGFDENWVETDSNNRQATFINVPAGDYQFEVKAAKHDGPWSEIKSLNITVLPPWWQTSLAYSLYTVLLVTLLWTSYRWRTKTIRNRSLALEQQIKERTTTISKLMAQKDQMFANISHEFRTPLTLILNPVQRLINSPKNQLNEAQIRNSHLSIEQNAQRLLRMVEQLLEFARTESNHQQAGLQTYSLKHTVSYLNACFDSLFGSKNLNVTIHDFSDANLALKPDSLEIMLSNLISNAVKYTPENGHIDINVEHLQTHITISIKDNGIGIAPEHQQLVFERFGRVEHRQADSTQASTGIGLALVKELVNANGGTIKLTSAINQGSCFTITLPKAEKTTSVDTESISEVSNNSKQITALEISNLTNITTAPKTPLTDLNGGLNDDDASYYNTSCYNTNDNNKPLVLIIDDNHELLELIQTIISPHFNCLLAPNGEQGIEKAQEHLPDLVISDLMMPGISGFDVLKTLKSDALTAHIPVIMLTAKGDAQSRIEGWNNQADEYLAKPFNDQELIARISNILAIRKIISGRYQQQFAQNPQEEKQQAADHQLDNQLDYQLDHQLDKVAQAFSQQLEQILANHYQNENLTVTTIAEQMALSNRQLIRKTKSIIGMTPIESLRTYRLNKAAELLTQGKTPSTIAYTVGFASHSYFAACFKAQYGCTPSNFQKK